MTVGDRQTLPSLTASLETNSHWPRAKATISVAVALNGRRLVCGYRIIRIPKQAVNLGMSVEDGVLVGVVRLLQRVGVGCAVVGKIRIRDSAWSSHSRCLGECTRS